MTAISISRIVLPLMAVVAAGSAVFAIQYVRREPPADTMAATMTPATSKAAPDTRVAPLTTAKAEANAIDGLQHHFGVGFEMFAQLGDKHVHAPAKEIIILAPYI